MKLLNPDLEIVGQIVAFIELHNSKNHGTYIFKDREKYGNCATRLSTRTEAIFVICEVGGTI
jgi:hypothetical protein